ncbi:MAG: ComF family protein [Gammaproteobacteria bacterium]|nr:ComF family protein [Gammaproteobacteria bacterium]
MFLKIGGLLAKSARFVHPTKLTARLFSFLEAQVFPFRCVLCLKKSDQSRDLCVACQKELPWLETICERCSVPLPSSGICGQCLRHPPSFRMVKALWSYEGEVKQLISELKFNHKRMVGRLMGELLAEAFTEFYSKDSLPQGIVPVPLHPARLRQRGYNQAEELAVAIARKVGRPLELKGCMRVRHTESQASLPFAKRTQNVANAFRCRAPFVYTHVAVVDDVVTTAGTVEQVARALSQQGVQCVDVWCCARTPLIPNP